MPYKIYSLHWKNTSELLPEKLLGYLGITNSFLEGMDSSIRPVLINKFISAVDVCYLRY